MAKVYKGLRLLCEEIGWSHEMTAGNHVRLTHPDVEGCYITGSTPSDNNVLMRIRADLKRSMRLGTTRKDGKLLNRGQERKKL